MVQGVEATSNEAFKIIMNGAAEMIFAQIHGLALLLGAQPCRPAGVR